MKRNKLTGFLLVFLLVTALSLSASAESYAGNEAAGVIDGSALLYGEGVLSEAEVNGILAGAGLRCRLGGTARYLICAGETVLCDTTVQDDFCMIGNSVSFSGDTGRDGVLLGNTVTVDGTVGRDAVLAGAEVFVNGIIHGNLQLCARRVVFGNGAVVEGDVICNSTAQIEGNEDLTARVQTYLLPGSDIVSSSFSTHTTVTFQGVAAQTEFSLKTFLYGTIGLILLALFLEWLTPFFVMVDCQYTGKSFDRYATSFGVGFAVLILSPIPAVVLLFTGFGTRLGFFIVFAYLVALTVAPLLLSFFIGTLLWRNLFRQNRSRTVELLLGIVVLRLIGLVPYLSTTLSVVTVPLGVGAVVTMFYRARKEEELLEHVLFSDRDHQAQEP